MFGFRNRQYGNQRIERREGMEIKSLTISVEAEGLDEIAKKAERLNSLIAEAKSLAQEITSATITISSQVRS